MKDEKSRTVQSKREPFVLYTGIVFVISILIFLGLVWGLYISDYFYESKYSDSESKFNGMEMTAVTELIESEKLIGKSEQEIIDSYGEPDYKIGNIISYYIFTELSASFGPNDYFIDLFIHEDAVSSVSISDQ